MAVQQHMVTLPNVNLHLGVYRVTASTQTLKTRPAQRFYIVWVFVKTSQFSRIGPPVERGEQVLQLPLRAD